MNSKALWARFFRGDPDARQELLTEQLALVHFVAGQVARGLGVDLEFDDLVSAGTLGLVSALENFEPERQLAFSTFATPRIRGAILDELRRQDHVPRSVRRKARAINAAREELAHTLDGPPSDKEIAAHLGVDLPTLWGWQADLERAVQVPLDDAATDHDGLPTPAEQLSSADADNVEDRLTSDQEAHHLRAALANMKEQERVVLSLYYFEELKLHEIAAILELTESRVSQIRLKALTTLRATLAPLRRNVA
ncbi:MAG: sigma-70 family RNA polymerase sigma factor [Gemmatimonadaceae bacterium]